MKYLVFGYVNGVITNLYGTADDSMVFDEAVDEVVQMPQNMLVGKKFNAKVFRAPSNKVPQVCWVEIGSKPIYD